jgi:hypothetical protein
MFIVSGMTLQMVMAVYTLMEYKVDFTNFNQENQCIGQVLAM